MPVYEYACDACARPFSRFFRSHAAAASASPACPHCGAATIRRTVSLFVKHETEQTKLDNLDPTFERQIDSAMAPHLATDPLNRVNLDFDPNR